MKSMGVLACTQVGRTVCSIGVHVAISISNVQLSDEVKQEVEESPMEIAARIAQVGVVGV